MPIEASTRSTGDSRPVGNPPKRVIQTTLSKRHLLGRSEHIPARLTNEGKHCVRRMGPLQVSFERYPQGVERDLPPPLDTIREMLT